MKLDKRLSAIAEFCDKVEVTADIGSDHGKLGLTLLNSGKTEMLIATDISAPSLEKTTKLLKGNFDGRFDCRVGDGLSTITPADNVNQLIIAGMGGREICNILNGGKSLLVQAQVLVLQPMRDVSKVRKALSTHNFKIVRDIVVQDKTKYYHILKAVHGCEALSEKQLEFGADAGEYVTVAFQSWLLMREQKVLGVLNKSTGATKINNKLIADNRQLLKCICELKIKE